MKKAKKPTKTHPQSSQLGAQGESAKDQELSQDELEDVAGGTASASLYQACATGKHIATGKITI